MLALLYQLGHQPVVMMVYATVEDLVLWDKVFMAQAFIGKNETNYRSNLIIHKNWGYGFVINYTITVMN
jgi:hypothetical protein